MFKKHIYYCSSCGRCGSIDWLQSTFVGTLITLKCGWKSFKVYHKDKKDLILIRIFSIFFFDPHQN
jgi:hypothetical protein